MNKKFKNTVLSGLQTFRALGFTGMPSEDAIVALAETWIDLLHPVRDWSNDSNITALVSAFKTTARNAERFPVPKDVIKNLEVLPTVFRALPAPTLTATESKEVSEMLEATLKEMRMPTKKQINK